MENYKITETDLSGKGVVGLADTPRLTTEQMQAKFDEIATDVVVPKFNSLVDKLDDDFATKADVTGLVFESRSSDMTKAVYDADLDGVVDNAAALGGEPPEHYAAAADAFSSYTHTLEHYAVLPSGTTYYNNFDDLTDTGATEAEMTALITGTQTVSETEYSLVTIAGAQKAVLSSACSTVNRVQALTGSGDNVKFTAAADFAEGDAFSVNGESATAASSDGEQLPDGAFKSGSVVSCFRNGAALNFKTGGAALNLKVVGGTSQPASPVENTVWVNTDTAITEWVFSSERPTAKLDGTALSGGEVWIRCGTSATAPLNALKKNAAFEYPNACFQYIAGAWAAKTAKNYNGSAWVSWDTPIWASGTLNTALTGGNLNGCYTRINQYAYAAGPASISYGLNDLTWTLSVAGQSSYCHMTPLKINMAEYSKLQIDISNTGTATGWILLTNSSPNSVEWSTVSATYIQINSGSNGIRTIDLSSLNGSYYLVITGYVNHGTVNLVIKSIFLTP